MSNVFPAFGYARVSTSEQADSGLGLQAQRSSISAYCVHKGLDLRAIHEDAGVSASLPFDSRPGGRALLGHALQLAKQNPQKAVSVVVSKLDRGWRSALDCLKTLKLLDDAGIALHMLDLNVDTRTPVGRLVVQVMAAVAEMERNRIGRRTRDALLEARALGVHLGPVPYGWRRAPAGAGIEPDPEQQRTLRAMRGLRSKGSSYRSIATALTKAQVPTPRGGQGWCQSTVRRILQRLRKKADQEVDNGEGQ